MQHTNLVPISEILVAKGSGSYGEREISYYLTNVKRRFDSVTDSYVSQYPWLLITKSTVLCRDLGQFYSLIFTAVICTLLEDKYLCKYAHDLSPLNPETACIRLNAEFDNLELKATL